MPKTKKKKVAVVKAEKNILDKCLCGCESLVRPKRRFRQGHDAKLKSTLLKAIAKGGAKDAAKAKRVLTALGWA